MRTLARLETGRFSAIAVLVLAAVAVGVLFALLPKTGTDALPQQSGPTGSESAEVDAITKDFPSSNQSIGLVAYASATSGSTLTAAQRGFISARAAALAELSSTPRAVRPRFSSGGTVAVVVVPLTATDDSTTIGDDATRLRTTARDGLPSGLRTWLTGQLGFQADTTGAFAGADTRLLLITAGVVALLLIVTYRSPLLWIVPLVVVAAADGLARFTVAWLSAQTGLQADASILGILSVLVFGAGTDYALLLIARYREGLLVEQSPRAAMRQAIGGAGPAILASGGTVVLSLLMLVFAALAGDQALGIACAVGLAIAVAFALLVLPAALVLCGRRLFWPFIPRVHDGTAPTTAEQHRVFWRVGGLVATRPTPVAIAALVLVGALCAGLAGAKIGLSQTQQLLGDPESVQGQAVLAAGFGAGTGGRTTVLARDGVAAQALTITKDTAGVASATTSDSDDGWTELDVTLQDAPASDGALDAIRALRAAYADGPGEVTKTLVGGTDATTLDQDDAAAADRALVIPLILGVVLLVLILLLRALVASVVLILSVVATYLSAMGAGNLLFQHVFGFPAFDTRTVLFSFLFLVALGVDYNIFLATRAREERALFGARAGMREALARTGPVITAAGVLLAAVFVVLGVLPVVALAQIGTVVCIGVLLDTLVVRTLLVPAIAILLGEAFWWPAPRPTGVTDRDGAPGDSGALGARDALPRR